MEPQQSVVSASVEPDGELHARLLSGDPTAPSDLVAAYLDGLAVTLRASFPAVDEQILETAAIDALLGLAQHPDRYDPSRAPLALYLRMSARGDVKNALRSEQRQRAHRAPVEDVELAQRAGNNLVEGPRDPAQEVLLGEPVPPDLEALIHSSFDRIEWQVVQLMLDGERRTGEYATVLGVEALHEIEQARAVKQVKDRLLKRLRRLAPKIRRDV